jgi:hypothetical protein
VEGNARRLSFRVERSTKSRLLGSSSETQESISASGLIPPVPVVGEYAGLSATFDIAGKLIPVPEYLIPPALLEWGQAPSSLETLVSIGSGKRWTATILPEAGCGVDNLQTTRTVESISGDDSSHDDIYSVDHAIHQQKLRVESYFGLELDGDINKEDAKFRSRLALNLQVQDDQKLQIIGPISVCLERQVEEISSSGTVGKGGGLDGRSVSRWLGALSKMQSFAERNMAGVSWVSSTHNDESNVNSDDDDHDATTLYLPGNLTLSYRSKDDSQFQLEMGQIHAASGLRHVIRRTFQGSTLANVESWVERGEYIMTNNI